MSYPLKRYPLDPTGRSINNFVKDEEHILGPKAGPYHPIAPFYGPFYNDPETLRIVVNESEVLVPGIDYWATNLISDATAKFSTEVGEIIILKNRNEGDSVVISYQNVGGNIQNHSKGLLDLYDAFLKDNRPIDWTKGLKNKPLEYPPSYHLHMLSDVVGWEPVIVAIERLINVLSLRNVPAFESLIDWILARTLEVVTEEEILNMEYVGKSVTFQRLLFSAKKLNYNAIRLEPRQLYRKLLESFAIDVKTTNFDDGEPIFWTIRHIDSFPHMFERTSGPIDIVGNEGTIFFKTTKEAGTEGVFTFVVEVRRNNIEGPVLATSKILTLEISGGDALDYGLLTNGLFQIPSTAESGLVQKTAEAMFLIPDDYFYEVSHV